jgi:hypothetical protein
MDGGEYEKVNVASWRRLSTKTLTASPSPCPGGTRTSICVWLRVQEAHERVDVPPISTETEALELPKFDPSIVSHVDDDISEPSVEALPTTSEDVTGTSYENEN